jgi:hypothetical protein
VQYCIAQQAIRYFLCLLYFWAVISIHTKLHTKSTHHRVVPTFTLAVNDLLVCQHSAQCRAPVDGHLCLIGQALLEQLQEDPLRPPGEVWGGGGGVGWGWGGRGDAGDIHLAAGFQATGFCLTPPDGNCT